VNIVEKLKEKLARKTQPEHLRRGLLGERAAKKYLKQQGLKFLAANFRSDRGEIDLIFRDGDCLLYVSFGINPVFLNCLAVMSWHPNEA
jgi:putative endonuclease